MPGLAYSSDRAGRGVNQSEARRCSCVENALPARPATGDCGRRRRPARRRCVGRRNGSVRRPDGRWPGRAGKFYGLALLMRSVIGDRRVVSLARLFVSRHGGSTVAGRRIDCFVPVHRTFHLSFDLCLVGNRSSESGKEQRRREGGPPKGEVAKRRRALMRYSRCRCVVVARVCCEEGIHTYHMDMDMDVVVARVCCEGATWTCVVRGRDMDMGHDYSCTAEEGKFERGKRNEKISLLARELCFSQGIFPCFFSPTLLLLRRPWPARAPLRAVVQHVRLRGHAQVEGPQPLLRLPAPPWPQQMKWKSSVWKRTPLVVILPGRAA